MIKFSTLHYFLFFILLLGAGCSLNDRELQTMPEKDTKNSNPVIEKNSDARKETASDLKELGKDFVYGNGLGTAALNVGTSILFPPFAIYVLGNAVSKAAFDKTFYVSDLLPEEEKKEFNSVYNGVTSGPGRFVSAVSSEEYRTQSRVDEHLKELKEKMSKKENKSAFQSSN